MKKILLSMLAIILCMSLLSGCDQKSPENNGSPSTGDTSDTSTRCTHDWKRTENLNEYTAVEQCSACGITRMYTDTDNISDSSPETGFQMLRYNWDGYGIGQKEIQNCDLGYAIIDCLSKLGETGDVIPTISEDTIDQLTVVDLPITKGTVWIECGSVGMFRLNPEMTEICKVQTHLGEGRVLQMTDTLKELLSQAWYYHPNDYWSASYKNGTVTLEQIYRTTSAVDWVEIENIHIENVHHSDNNQITLRIQAAKTQTVTVSLQSYQSNDNLGGGDSKTIELVSGEETTVDLAFWGFYNCTYQVSIKIDNTRIHLTVDPRNSN